MTLRAKHRHRTCFRGLNEVVVLIRIDGLDDLVDQINRDGQSLEQRVRPKRYLQRYADNMAGNGRKWKNR